MARWSDTEIDSERALLSVPVRVEGGDGHVSGSGLSAAVGHHDTTVGLSQNDDKIDGETEVVELWCWRLTGSSREARISEEALRDSDSWCNAVGQGMVESPMFGVGN
jgi:hypothetical protein